MDADGRTAEALRAVETILKGNPDDWSAHRLAGVLLWRLARDAESLPAFLRAIELAPAETAAQIDLANAIVTVATDLQDVNATRIAFETSKQVLQRFGATKELITKTVGLHLFLSRISRRPEDFAETLEWADEALRLFPAPTPVSTIIPIHMHRSLALLNLGRLEESVTAYALGQLKPHNPKADARSGNVVNLYAGLATGYDDNTLHQSFSQRMVSFITETIGPIPALRALDAGCGTGLLAVHGKAAQWVGIDSSPAMLAKARARGVYGSLIEGDMRDVMAGLTDTFDVIASSCALYHIADLAPIFRESARLLAPGGYLFFSVDPAPDTTDIADAQPGEYAHSRAYLRRLAKENGLSEVVIKIMEHRAYPGFWCAFRQIS